MTHDEDALERLAQELYPEDAYLRQQWLRGVHLVRTTARGWLLDPPVLRKPRHASTVSPSATHRHEKGSR